MKKKVGIVTRYFDNFNYGGLLQSYALQCFVEMMGFDAKQISLDYNVKQISLKSNIIKQLRDIIKKFFFQKYALCSTTWRQKMKEFEESIPHTEKIYTKGNIIDCVDEFDIFVCGSDQIWNPNFSDLYLFCLGFVPDCKKKISYSASIGKGELSETEKSEMYSYLKSFDFISIREKQLQGELSQDIEKDIFVVCDPTMLLQKKDWDNLKEKSNIGEKYIFAYLLGNNEMHRQVIYKFAQGKGLKIVFIPYVITGYSNYRNNLWFGDFQPDDIGPAAFLDLIENAEYVITDSFHATVFSIIYHTDFYVLDRNSSQSRWNMNSRLYTLLDYLLLEDRFITNERLAEIKLLYDSIPEIKWDDVEKKMDEYRDSSIDFLKCALEV